jgi:hypothetical protein
MYTDLSLFHIRIKNICCADCFVAFILLGLLYVPLKCAAWSFVADVSMRAGGGSRGETTTQGWTRRLASQPGDEAGEQGLGGEV